MLGVAVLFTAEQYTQNTHSSAHTHTAHSKAIIINDFLIYAHPTFFPFSLSCSRAHEPYRPTLNVVIIVRVWQSKYSGRPVWKRTYMVGYMSRIAAITRCLAQLFYAFK